MLNTIKHYEYLGGLYYARARTLIQFPDYSVHLAISKDYDRGEYIVEALYEHRLTARQYYFGYIGELTARKAWRAYRVLRQRFLRGLFVVEREYKQKRDHARPTRAKPRPVYPPPAQLHPPQPPHHLGSSRTSLDTFASRTCVEA